MHFPRRLVVSITLAAALGAATVAGAAAVRNSRPVATVPRVAPAVTPRKASLVAQQVRRGRYRISVEVRPNCSTAVNTVIVRITRSGRAVAGAHVALSVRMLEMAMPGVRERLRSARSGRYMNTDTALGMIGRWGFQISIRPRHQEPFSFRVVDRVSS